MTGEVLVYGLVQVAAGPGWWWWRRYGRAAVRGGKGAAALVERGTISIPEETFPAGEVEHLDPAG